MPRLRVHDLSISLDGPAPAGLECVEFVGSPSVAHVRSARAGG